MSDTKKKDEAASESKGISFSALILGFSSAALYHIGEASIDGHKTLKPNLELAKQNVDSLKVLKEKTRGNLSHTEEKLLDSVLKDILEKIDSLK